MGKNKWMKNLAHNLSWIRKTYGLSQHDMAKMLGIGKAGLHALEHETIPPRLTIDFLFRIKEQFDITPSVMFEQELK